MIKKEQLLQIVTDNRLLSPEIIKQLKLEAAEKGVPVEDLLIRRVDEEELAKVEANLTGLKYENLLDKKIEESVLNIIAPGVAENYRVICFEKTDHAIKVGITDPNNFKAIEAVDFIAKEEGLRVEYYIISDSSYKQTFKLYESLAKELSSALEIKAGEQGESEDLMEARKQEEITQSAPVAKMVSVVIRHGVEGGASDIHIEPMKNESRIRYRIDGILHTSLVLPKNIHQAVVGRIKVMCNMKLDETRIPQDGRFHLAINSKAYDFRVSTLPLAEGEKVVMRILDTTKGAPKIEDLGVQGDQLRIIKENIKRTEGMILVTGPTGSGKSTTLFALLDMLNKEGVNISTLEDPIEYQIKGINQSQIKPEIGYTFSSGLRSFLRQDPDIILVGEIRDEETAELAVHAALTGHLVLSTLHTNSALATIPRLWDMKVEPFLIGSTVHTIIAQRLVRKICPHCQETIAPPKEAMSIIMTEIKDMGEEYVKSIIKDYSPKKIMLTRGKGCSRCGNSGYTGRLAILEVLDVDEKLKGMIQDEKNNITREDVRVTQKYITILQDGVLKVLQGMTSMEEVLRVMKE